jgi:hypothetical protein
MLNTYELTHRLDEQFYKATKFQSYTFALGGALAGLLCGFALAYTTIMATIPTMTEIQAQSDIIRLATQQITNQGL